MEYVSSCQVVELHRIQNFCIITAGLLFNRPRVEMTDDASSLFGNGAKKELHRMRMQESRIDKFPSCQALGDISIKSVHWIKLSGCRVHVHAHPAVNLADSAEELLHGILRRPTDMPLNFCRQTG